MRNAVMMRFQRAAQQVILCLPTTEYVSAALFWLLRHRTKHRVFCYRRSGQGRHRAFWTHSKPAQLPFNAIAAGNNGNAISWITLPAVKYFNASVTPTVKAEHSAFSL